MSLGYGLLLTLGAAHKRRGSSHKMYYYSRKGLQNNHRKTKAEISFFFFFPSPPAINLQEEKNRKHYWPYWQEKPAQEARTLHSAMVIIERGYSMAGQRASMGAVAQIRHSPNWGGSDSTQHPISSPQQPAA